MHRLLTHLLERYPAESGDPTAAWRRYFLRVADGLRDRLASGAIRRALHAGRGLVWWLPGLLNAGGCVGRHYAAPFDGAELPALRAALAELPGAARVVQEAAGKPALEFLSSFPSATLDLVVLLWPPDAPGAGRRCWLDTALASAARALAPGGWVAVAASVDGSPAAPLTALRRALRELDPRFDLPPGTLPCDDEDLRNRLTAAGFADPRTWREGLSLAFPDAAAALDHFLARGGDSLLAAPEVRPHRARLIQEMTDELTMLFSGQSAVALSFEAAVGLGRIAGSKS